MSFTFRPAKREGTHLLVGLIGGSGSGKSCSALRLATGLAGGKRFAAIDTEAGRLKHFADDFGFDHGDLAPPFTPDAYWNAIHAADQAGYPVIIVDSMSHEHNGEGGLLDWHDRELDEAVARKMKRNPDADEWAAREAANIGAWIKPKVAHKAMVSRLLQLRAHLILCFRAEQKIKMQKDGKGKTQVVDAGWLPICAKGLEFELTASFLLSHERAGVPDTPLKTLPPSLRGMFPPGAPIDEATGKRLAEWANGTGGDAPIRDATRALIGSFASLDKPALASVFARESAEWRALPEADQTAIKAALRDRATTVGLAGLKGLAELAASVAASAPSGAQGESF